MDPKRMKKKQSTENLYGFASIWTQAHEKKQSKKSKKSKMQTLNQNTNEKNNHSNFITAVISKI